MLEGRTLVETLLSKSTMNETKPKHFRVPVSIRTDNSFETFTLLEITALDRIGLLYGITQVFQNHGIQILTAKISSYGEKAVDVFYVRDLFGLKLAKHKLSIVTRSLQETIEKLS